ncbi:MAG: hypothetical protein Q9227_002664 [Pyrenula ochraceoflavens]
MACQASSRLTFGRSLASSHYEGLPKPIEVESHESDYNNLEQRVSRQGDNASMSKPPTEAINPATAIANVPWYLQVQPPIAAPKPADVQALPPLPEIPPPILQPILHQLYNEIGLDDLSLLDLRKFDPPPALGASLIMLLATARSVKHLNHSADRFCRWLRSEYKLSPHADGLLGRNELKLKLRRKARRAKLASSVGRPVDPSSDDGINTGWICVNVGVVDGGPEYARERDERAKRLEGFTTGFGIQEDGPRIVVQMFTEEKREEVNLEGLYDVRAMRREKKGAKITEELEEPSLADVGDLSPEAEHLESGTQQYRALG